MPELTLQSPEAGSHDGEELTPKFEITVFMPVLDERDVEPGFIGDFSVPFGVGDLVLRTKRETRSTGLDPTASTDTPYATEKAVQTGDEKGRSDIETDQKSDKRD
jgi:hypothetical protein